MHKEGFIVLSVLSLALSNVSVQDTQETRAVDHFKLECTNNTCENFLRVSVTEQPSIVPIVTGLSDFNQLKNLVGELYNEFVKDATQTAVITKELTSSVIALAKMLATIERKVNTTDAEVKMIQKNIGNLEKAISAINNTMEREAQVIVRPESSPENLNSTVGGDCSALLHGGFNFSGIYTLQPDPDDTSSRFKAFCDMKTNGGGWTVIQRRMDGSDDFFRDWQSYKHGFGDLNHDFWIGLDNIHKLTKFGNTKLRIDLHDWEGESRFSEFSFTRVADETDGYRIRAGNYSGNGGDPFHTQRYSDKMQSMRFSTHDRDNDLDPIGNCAVTFNAGWWFNNCFLGNLNGVWYSNSSYIAHSSNGIIWDLWRDHPRGYSLKAVEMKLRSE